MTSEMKRKALKIEKNFHELLLEHVRALVFVKDRDYRMLYANKAVLDLYPPEERASVVGRPSAENFSEEEAKVFNAEDEMAFQTGFTEIVEEISDYTGRKFMFQTQKIRYMDEQGDVRILGIGTDVTRLVEREKLLAKSNVALENFAAVAAHDLRSPLAALRVSLDIIRNDGDTELGERAERHIALMSTCLEGLIDQVAQLLATYKIGKEDEAPQMECDISILFEEVKFNLSSYIQHARAKVLSTALPKMTVNKSMFRQLIHNLIENSLKYKSDSKPIIILRYKEEGTNHCFSVEDNGLGVLPENRHKIFGFAAQADQHHEGYGIGLALCKKIVEMHGGRIWLDENYKSGTRICFNIPRYPVLVQ